MPFFRIHVPVQSTAVYLVRATTPHHAVHRLLQADPTERQERFFSHAVTGEPELEGPVEAEMVSQDVTDDEVRDWLTHLLRQKLITQSQHQQALDQLSQLGVDLWALIDKFSPLEQ